MAGESILNGTANTGTTATGATSAGTTASVSTHTAPFRVFNTEEEFNAYSAALRKRAEKDAAKELGVTTEDGKPLDLEALREKVRAEEREKIREVVGKEAVEKYKRELEMTEAEKFAERQKEWEKQVREKDTEFNKREAKQLMKEAGFTDDRIELELNYVNYDREASISRIVKLCELQKTEYESVKKQVLQQFSASNPSIQIATGDANTLQAQYDEAKRSGNAAMMAKIIRQASINKIQIKQ